MAQNIDPAIGLAMFGHESGYGLHGVATKTRNWGNLRKSLGRAHHVADGWAWYTTWADGAADWALLMRAYVGRGLTTVARAIPVYAPSSDGNAPTAYIDAVLGAVGLMAGRRRAVARVGHAVPAARGRARLRHPAPLGAGGRSRRGGV